VSIIEKYFPFVDDQITFQEKMAAKYAKIPYRQKLHLGSRDKFAALKADLEAINKKLDEQSPGATAPAISQQQSQQLALTPEDVQGLPPELLSELSISTSDRAEFDIITLINDAGGLLTLDRILIGLFRKTGEIHKRATMTSRLYRMGQKGLISSVPNRKGLYATSQVTEDQGQASEN